MADAAAPTKEETKKRKAEDPNEYIDSFTLKRLTKELKRIPKDSMEMENKFSVELEDEKINRWVVKYFYDSLPSNANKHAKRIASQLKERGLTYIEFKFIYSNEYPGKPPFVSNSFPRLQGSFISPCGALCHESLHPEHGWTAGIDMGNFVIGLRSVLEEDCKASLFTDAYGKSDPELMKNDEETARKTNSFFLAAHKSGY